MSTDERIAYVISDYATPHLASLLVSSIEQYRPGSEIRVVDALARQFGYSQALNYGIRNLVGHPEIICCLNADTRMLEHDDAILGLFDENPEVAIVGPRQLTSDDRIAHGGIVAFEDGTDWDVDLRHRCWLWPLADADELTRITFDVPMVAGSVLYARCSALDTLGGWPEAYRFYYEDHALCVYARHAGHRVLYTGSVTWRHYGEAAPVTAGWREQMMEQSRAVFVSECERRGILLRQTPVEIEMRLETWG